mgnify:CR=1 FL=1
MVKPHNSFNSKAGATVVTAADQGFSRCLTQLLLSAERHRCLSYNLHWICYDIGIDSKTMTWLRHRFTWCEFRSLELNTLPSHYQPRTRSFAWKPYILWQVVEKSEGVVLWMDSATIVKTALDRIIHKTEDNGIFLLRGQAPILTRCDPKVLDSLDFPPKLYGMREFCAAFLGINQKNARAKNLVRNWAKLAARPELLLPDPILSERHMNDQAVLNCLLLPQIASGELVWTGEEVDISSPAPILDISTRNKLCSAIPVWLDPICNTYFRIVKSLDQAWLRLDQWHGRTRVIHRWLNEYYDVYIRRLSDGKTIRLPCPFGHYYADPFLWEENGCLWLFVEDFRFTDRHGSLAAIQIDGMKAKNKVNIRLCDAHTSFPYLFRYKNKLFMVPETCASNTVDIYECIQFPANWRKTRTVLKGVDAADSAIFEHNNKWWLLTSLESPDSGGFYRYLALYYSDEPITGKWTEHPITNEALYMDAPKGTGRNAGFIEMELGKLIRPRQESNSFYGEGMRFMSISTLTLDSYIEKECAPPKALSDVVGRLGVHHITRAGNFIAWDVRKRN